MSRKRYLDLWRSNNRVCTAAGERLGALLDEVGRAFDRCGEGSVEIPYVCRAWTAATGH